MSEILFGSKIIEINEDTTIYVNPMTIEQNVYAQRVFKRAYDEALLSGVLTRKEMLELLEEQEIWTKNEEGLLDKLSNKSEDLKLSIYNNFLRKQKRESARKELREVEKKQASLYEKKHSNDHLDCQGIATYARLNWVIENTTTYKDGTPYSFDEIDVTGILKRAGTDTLEPSDYRELARNEPWKSLWVMREAANAPLFPNHVGDLELTNNQKGLIIWSQTYDNIQESLDCPSKDVIEDDDMLDGWFIVQGQKRDKEKSEQEFENSTQNEKIKNSPEVFIFANTERDKDRIDNMNDVGGRVVKAQREALMKRSSGSTAQNEFQDEKIKFNQMSNQQFKGKFGG